MTDLELNKRIHKIMGLCQHHWIFTGGKQGTIKCTKCKEFRGNPVPNFNFTGSWQTSAYEFGLMWEFMRKHKDWTRFCVANGWHIPRIEPNSGWCLPVNLISPRPFAEAMCAFFEEEDKP